MFMSINQLYYILTNDLNLLYDYIKNENVDKNKAIVQACVLEYVILLMKPDFNTKYYQPAKGLLRNYYF